MSKLPPIMEDAQYLKSVQDVCKIQERANKNWVTLILLSLIFWPAAIGYISGWLWAIGAFCFFMFMGLPASCNNINYTNYTGVIYMSLLFSVFSIIGGLLQIRFAKNDVQNIEAGRPIIAWGFVANSIVAIAVLILCFIMMITLISAGTSIELWLINSPWVFGIMAVCIVVLATSFYYRLRGS